MSAQDSQEQLIGWLKVMGYKGKIPKTLANIYTPETSHIWSQLTSTVKPRSQVDAAKKNIILNRFQKQSLLHEEEFLLPLKEIEVYKQKRDLEETVRQLESDVNEKEARIEKILSENKSKYVALNGLKQKTKQNKERSYVLNKKSQKLIEDIRQVKAMTTMAKDLIPIETEEDGDEAQAKINETLQKCAKELERRVETVATAGATSISIVETSVSVGINTNILSSNKHRKNTERMSLGLLPDSCLSDDVLSEDFLISDLDKSVFECSSLLAASIQTSNKSENVLDQLCCNKEVCETLKTLLHAHNKNLILKNCEVINNDLLSTLVDLVLQCGQFENKSNIVSQDDMAELYFLHVKRELDATKHNAIANQLNQELRNHKVATSDQLAQKPQTAFETTEKLELQIKKVQLESTVNFLKEEISQGCELEISRELELTKNEINKTKDEIASKISSIKNYVENIYKLLESIRSTREETVASVSRLNQFTMNFFWLDAMKQPLFSREMMLFKNFPLEYNRVYNTDGLKIPHRDVCDNTTLIDLDPNILHMTNILISTPFRTAEAIIYDKLHSKVKLRALRSLQQPAENLEYQKYSLDELVSNEDYITDKENEVSSTIHASLKQTSAISSNIRSNMELWTDLPFQDYVSSERKVNGCDYKYYEKKFDK